MKTNIRIGLLLTVLTGCGGSLEPGSDCSPIADGTYAGDAGDTVVVTGGGVAGWECSPPSSSCPFAVTCAPKGETVYTTTLENLGDGRIDVTQSPPGVPIEMALQAP